MTFAAPQGTVETEGQWLAAQGVVAVALAQPNVPPRLQLGPQPARVRTAEAQVGVQAGLQSGQQLLATQAPQVGLALVCQGLGPCQGLQLLIDAGAQDVPHQAAQIAGLADGHGLGDGAPRQIPGDRQLAQQPRIQTPGHPMGLERSIGPALQVDPQAPGGKGHEIGPQFVAVAVVSKAGPQLTGGQAEEAGPLDLCCPGN